MSSVRPLPVGADAVLELGLTGASEPLCHRRRWGGAVVAVAAATLVAVPLAFRALRHRAARR
ncbi:hypothetical protein [Actinomadura geliboluensis]|uniref:hypothetical protein n=1 Tax=Actinomadura geliboluensis TaxID=882440 RepID=UPI0036BF8BE9